MIVGALFGLLMERILGPAAARAQQRIAQLSVGLSPSQRRSALMSCRRGPVPDDPAVRAAALQIADYRLTEADRQRTANIMMPIVFVALGAVLAVTATPVWWGVTAIMIVSLCLGLWQRRQTRRQRRLFADA